MFDTVNERAIVLRQLTNGASDALPIDKTFAEIVKGCSCPFSLLESLLKILYRERWKESLFLGSQDCTIPQ
jgi:hypothetical protein